MRESSRAVATAYSSRTSCGPSGRLRCRRWFFDHFTCADAYFFWCFRRGTMFKPDVSSFVNCMAHLKRMEQYASVQKLLAYEKQVKEAFAKAV
jgi:glutathione S-transferase